MGPAYPPPPPTGPPPPAVPAALLPSSPRYAYLVARLRNRQITMEEATELFGLLQSALANAARAIRQTAASPTPSPGGRPSPMPSGAPTPNRSPTAVALRDEDLALGILGMGAGAGLLAAVLKRGALGAAPPAGKK